MQGKYSVGQEVYLVINVFNQENPALNSTLSLTITGPGDYYLYDFQNIIVPADIVGEYAFDYVAQMLRAPTLLRLVWFLHN